MRPSLPTPASPALATLQAAAREAEALQRSAAALLDVHVRVARSSGLSWASVGLALGVTRQAAQQRFGSDEASINRLNEGPVTLSDVLREAQRTGHTYLGTEHVLLAILKICPDIMAPVLDRAGVSAKILRQEVRDQVGISEPGKTVEMLISTRLRRSLARASDRSASRGRYELVATDLLHGISLDRDAVATQAMRSVGIDLDQMRHRFEQE